MARALCLLSAVGACVASSHSIGIFLPWSANPFTSGGQVSYVSYGKRIHPAIATAFSVIKNDTTLLPEVRNLTWVWHDDGCDDEKSTYASLQLFTEWGVKAIIGPSCTSITRTIAKSAFFYDIPVIGYSIPSFTRDASTDQPNLIRTVAAYTSLDLITLEFFTEFGWDKVGLLYESGLDTSWAETAIQINSTLTSAGISVFSTFILSALETSSAAASASRIAALTSIKEVGYRIVFVIGGCSNNIRLGEEMIALGMQDGYAAFSISNLDGRTCYTAEDYKFGNSSALNNTMYITAAFPDGDKFEQFAATAYEAFESFTEYLPPPNGTSTPLQTSISNPFHVSYDYTLADFKTLAAWKDEWGYLSYLHDGILLYARALNYTLSNGLDSSYTSILSAIPHVTPFEGAWRDVRFNTSEPPFDRQLSHRVYEFFLYPAPYDGFSDLTPSWVPIAEKVSPSSPLSMLVSKESLVWPGPSSTIPTDYVNPNKVACTPNDVKAILSAVFASTRTYEVRYAFKSGVNCDTSSYSLPADQYIGVNRFPVTSAVGVVCVLCACTGFFLCICCCTFALVYRRHKLLEATQLNWTMIWFALALVASCSPLFFLGTPSNALCQVRNWALFLPGFMLYSLMLAKVYHLSVALNTRLRRSVKASGSTTIMARAFGIWNMPLILLLIIGSAYEGPSTTTHIVTAYHAPDVTINPFECENVNSGVFKALITYVAFMVVFGLLLTSKALGGLAIASSLWSNSKRTWEVRLTTYCTFLVLLVQLELVIASLYVNKVGLDMVRVLVCLSVSLATSASLCIMWIPKTALILNEKIHSSGTVESPKTSRSAAGVQSHSSRKGASKANQPNPEEGAEVVVPFEALFSNVPNRASTSGIALPLAKTSGARDSHAALESDGEIGRSSSTGQSYEQKFFA